MEYEINQIPFKMSEISTKLFNSPFLSDVLFIVEGKQIYAHSLELMKRSSVFQSKLLEPTMDEKKIIQITGHRYEIFYELIQFIYTDECDIRDETRLELLKLATAYKVIRLVNVLVDSIETYVEKLNFAVVENHKIVLNDTKLKVAYALDHVLQSNSFLSSHPDTVDEILKLDQVTRTINEMDLVNALYRWLQHYAIQNQILLVEGCEKFVHLIRLIRFPTLSKEELRAIKNKYPGLLRKSDFLSICGHKILGPDYEDGFWNCTPRKVFVWPYEWKALSSTNYFQTKFSVSTEMILGGFVFGKSGELFDNISIAISCDHPELNWRIETKLRDDHVRPFSYSVAIDLGTSIRIRPNVMYTIGYKIAHASCSQYNEFKFKHWSRKSTTELIINASQYSSVQVCEGHETMHEILFLLPSEIG